MANAKIKYGDSALNSQRRPLKQKLLSRLSRIEHGFAGTTHDVRLDFLYNPASQIVSTTRSNPSDPAAADPYPWTGHGNGTTSSSADGRNRLDGHGGAVPTYDARGNLTFDGTFSYAYSSENLLTSGANSGTLEYDPLMRFYRNFSTYFIHDGPTGQFIGDYYNGNTVGRYVPGPDADEALMLIDKFGNRTWLHADERGSVIASSGGTGANNRVVLFDEYGKRGSGDSWRFGFTGQIHLINDIYDYKSRNYNARLGRFLQADPIGYAGGPNLYAYVGNDPANFTDPLGLKRNKPDIPPKHDSGGGSSGDIVVNGPADQALRDTLIILNRIDTMQALNSRQGTNEGANENSDADGDGQPDPDIVVTGHRPAVPGANPTFAQRLGQCASDQLGLTDLIEAGLVASGQPISGTKRFVTPGSSKGTSLAGMASDRIFGKARLPIRLPTIVGGPGTGRALAVAGTKSVARFAGRAVPIVGWALLAYDAVSIAVCTARER